MISRDDAYAIRLKLIGMPVPDGVKVSPLVSALLAGLPTGQEGFILLQNILLQSPDIQSQVLNVNPNEPPQKRELEVYVPPLPAKAQISDDLKAEAKSAGRWLDNWLAWATARSPMTPPRMLESGAIWAIGLTTARRVYLPLHDKVYPHLYILWVATTTRYAKSTGLKCIRDTVYAAAPHLLIPGESSPEALIDNLAGELPPNLGQLSQQDQQRINTGRLYAAQRGMLIDEASSLLGNQKKDYMQGLSEWLLQAYDAPEQLERSTRKDGMRIVRRLSLSILGATTPAAMGRYVGVDRWEDGDMARYALLCPEGVMPFDDKVGEYEPPVALVDRLKALHDALPKPNQDVFNQQPAQAIAAKVEPGVKQAFSRYREALMNMSEDLDVRLHGNYGRLPVQVAKVALNLALIDWSEQAQGNIPTVRLAHWARAQMIVESWRASLHRLLVILAQTVDSQAQDRIAKLLKNSPTGLTLREISRSTGIPTVRLQSAIEVLAESGNLEAVEVKPETGPSTRLYRWNLSAN